jgi:aldose 1-epimerase
MASTTTRDTGSLSSTGTQGVHLPVREDSCVLENGTLRAVVSPTRGAEVDELSFKTTEGWIRVTPATPPTFLMAPYCNRIRDGRFTFQGKQYQLADRTRHALHGDVRTQPWVVTDQTPTSIQLQFTSTPRFNPSLSAFENFPFSYRAVVTYELNENNFLQSVDIYNIGEQDMPTGCGVHPYYRRELTPGETVELQFHADGEYPWTSEVPLPEGPLQPPAAERDFRELKPIVKGLDHCYGGWDGEALLYWPKSKIAGRVFGTANQRHIVVYTPAEDASDEPFFCFEAVTNMNDAFNFMDKEGYDTGAVILKPGQSLKTTCTLTLESGVERHEL